jgi:hypothetical protein
MDEMAWIDDRFDDGSEGEVEKMGCGRICVGVMEGGGGKEKRSERM